MSVPGLTSRPVGVGGSALTCAGLVIASHAHSVGQWGVGSERPTPTSVGMNVSVKLGSGPAGSGPVSHGPARRGKAWILPASQALAWLGLARRATDCCGSVRLAPARHAVARLVKTWRGMARCAPALLGHGVVWQGEPRHDVVRTGWMCQGRASRVPAGRGQVWLGTTGRGVAWLGFLAGQGKVRLGLVRPGTARHGVARLGLVPRLGGAWLGAASSWLGLAGQRLAGVGHGEVRPQMQRAGSARPTTFSRGNSTWQLKF